MELNNKKRETSTEKAQKRHDQVKIKQNQI